MANTSTYIDNYAVVQRWAGDKRGHTRGRSKEPARAVWNRLDAIKTAQRVAGSTTRVQWVHSHVDATKQLPEGEPVEKKSQRAEGGAGKARQGKQEAPQCTCGEAEGKCNPDHVHHKGNDVADELANLGRTMPVPGMDYHSPLCREERVHNYGKGRGSVQRGHHRQNQGSKQAATVNDDAGGQGTHATAVRNAGSE